MRKISEVATQQAERWKQDRKALNGEFKDGKTELAEIILRIGDVIDALYNLATVEIKKP